MKTITSKNQRESGSAILMVVIITALAAIVLVSYMQLVKSQNYATVRSQAWNFTLPIIEAGVEDAMAHLNAHGSTNISCDGWTNTSGMWINARAVNGGQDYYVVTISNFVAGATNALPVIDARGYVQMPVLLSSVSPNNYAMLAVGGASGASQGVLARGIRVNTGRNALYSKGLVAKGRIDINGNDLASDSFDSTDPLYSGTNGIYDPSKHKANGDIASNSGLTNSVSIGNAEVLGHVSTGPGGSVDIGPNGVVGDLTWFADGHTGAQTGYLKDDMNVTFAAAPQPPGGGTSMGSGGTVNGVTYDNILGNGNYEVANLTGGGNQKILVTGTNTQLYVRGDVTLTGNDLIQLAPGANFKMYVGGTTVRLGGNGVLNPGSAMNFTYYGLATNASMTMSGNASFTGVIYAPDTNLTLGGGGSSNYDFVGAAIANTVTMNGHYHFHYDEALSKYGPNKGYVVTSWNEMSPGEVRGLSAQSTTQILPQ